MRPAAHVLNHIFTQAKQRLFAEAQEQNIQVKQLLLNSDLRKVCTAALHKSAMHSKLKIMQTRVPMQASS